MIVGGLLRHAVGAGSRSRVTVVDADVLGPLDLQSRGPDHPAPGPKATRRPRLLVSSRRIGSYRSDRSSTAYGAILFPAGPNTLSSNTSRRSGDCFESSCGSEVATSVLVTRSPGYVLVVDTLDADGFEVFAAAGNRAASATRWHRGATRRSTAALGCWKGPALADTHRASARAAWTPPRSASTSSAWVWSRGASMRCSNAAKPGRRCRSWNTSWTNIRSASNSTGS